MAQQDFGEQARIGPTAARSIVPPRDRQLEAALAGDAIEIRFQPQIDPVSGRIVGVEALARWAEVTSPEALFTRAIAAGLAERLSRTIQRKALRLAGAWGGALGDLRLSLNVLPQDLDRRGLRCLAARRNRRRRARPAAHHRRDHRKRLAARPPGGGGAPRRVARRAACASRSTISAPAMPTSLYLTSLPLDAIKIDRAMVADLVGRERDRIVVKAMIAMARELGLEVVVEGVESLAQLALIAEWGATSTRASSAPARSTSPNWRASSPSATRDADAA